MSKFEKYHPILTEHYTFDWLTKARAKDVFALYQQLTPNSSVTMLTTATTINQTMRDIFHDRKLIWGISSRQTDHFIGQAGFDPIDLDQLTATLTVQLLPADHNLATLTELYTRLTAFGTQELGLTRLNVTIPATDQLVAQVLTTLKFKPVTKHQPDQLTFQLA